MQGILYPINELITIKISAKHMIRILPIQSITNLLVSNVDSTPMRTMMAFNKNKDHRSLIIS